MSNKTDELLARLCVIGVLAFTCWVIWSLVTLVVELIMTTLTIVVLISSVGGYGILWYNAYCKKNNIPMKKALIKINYNLEKGCKLTYEDKLIVLRLTEYCENMFKEDKEVLKLIECIKIKCDKGIQSRNGKF